MPRDEKEVVKATNSWTPSANRVEVTDKILLPVPTVPAGFRPGHCPTCKHPQHLGIYCSTEVSTEAKDNGHGIEFYPVRCGCSPANAIKMTTGKVRGFRMFAWEVLPEILGIYQYGIQKGYLPDSWRKVPVEEYEDAFMRHVIKFMRGQTHDEESGKREIGHIVWNGIAIMALTKE